MAQQPFQDSLESEEEKSMTRFERKARDSPFMIGGILGCVGAVGFGAYRFKNRGTMPISLYLMQLRVVAQGAVIFSLTAGVVYSLGKKLLYPPPPKKQL